LDTKKATPIKARISTKLRNPSAIYSAYGDLVGKPEGKKSLGRPRRMWEDIKIDLRKIGWRSIDWIDLAQGRNQWRALVNTVMNLRVP
jgi:hypothetical protein